METSNGRKEDRRIRKTKESIRSHFIQLMKEKSIGKITVREITELVDISRGTFYQYYRNINALLNSMEKEILEHLEHSLTEINIIYPLDEKNVSHQIADIFELLKENKDLTVALFGPNGDPAFVKKVRHLMRKHCLEDCLTVYENTLPPWAFNYYYAFIESGCTGLFEYWLRNDCRETPREMAELLIKVCIKGLDILK